MLIWKKIFDTVKASCHKTEAIQLNDLGLVEKLPESLGNFVALKELVMNKMNGIKTLPTGSIPIASSDISHVALWGGQLEEIQPDFIHFLEEGTLNGANLVLSYNKLKKLDEKVFKPLLTDLEVTLFIYGNSIPCDCDLAWLLRDNPKLLEKVLQGECNYEGKTFSFHLFDTTLLKC